MNDEKNFIERLTREQLNGFIKSLHQDLDYFRIVKQPSSEHFDRIRVTFFTKDHGFYTHYLSDFEAKVEHPEEWTKLLYKLFGKEYEDAFIHHYLH